MMESLRVHLADSSIGVSAFCPGVIKSNFEQRLKDVEFAFDPLEVGRLVLRGIRNNDLYILTHPEFAPIAEDRYQASRSCSPTDQQPSAERVKIAQSIETNSIYLREQERQRCVTQKRARA